MAPQAVCFYEFGAFRTDPAKRLLWREGEVVSLTPKCFEILLAFVESSGQVVEKRSSLRRCGPTAILKQLETGKEYISPFELAVLYTSLGEREKAFTSFEKAYAAHDPQLLYLKVTPDFDPLRSDPRFTDLMGRVGLPQ